MDPLGLDPDHVTEPLGTDLGVADHRVHLREHPVGGPDLAGGGLGRKYVMGGHYPWPVRGKQGGVDRRHGQPLVVDDIGVEFPSEPHHVGNMLGELEQAPSPGVETAFGAAAVEVPADLVSVGLGYRSVEELGGDQLDIGSTRGQRPAEGVVVGRREGRGVDLLNSHCLIIVARSATRPLLLRSQQ